MSKLSKKDVVRMIKNESDNIKVPDLTEKIKNNEDFPITVKQNRKSKLSPFKFPFRLAALAVLLILCVITLPMLLHVGGKNPIEDKPVKFTKDQLMVQATSLFNIAYNNEATSLNVGFILLDDDPVDYEHVAKEIHSYLTTVEDFFNKDLNTYDIVELHDGKYQYKATVNIMIGTDKNTYTMYYNERPVYDLDEDDDIDEVSSSLDGYIENGNVKYYLYGTKDIEGNECEVELKLFLDNEKNDYILMKQETEYAENEYSYEFYSNGVLIKKLEIELEEQTNLANKIIEVQEIDILENTEKAFEFEFHGDYISCSYELDDAEGTVKIRNNSEYYVFNFENGQRVLINKKNILNFTNKIDVSFVL